MNGQSEIDETDVKILKILQADLRTSYSQIAETCETSIDIVRRRCEKLKRDWIWYSTLSLNFEKLGYAGHVSSLIKVSNKNWVPEVFNQLI